MNIGLKNNGLVRRNMSSCHTWCRHSRINKQAVVTSNDGMSGCQISISFQLATSAQLPYIIFVSSNNRCRICSEKRSLGSCLIKFANTTRKVSGCMCRCEAKIHSQSMPTHTIGSRYRIPCRRRWTYRGQHSCCAVCFATSLIIFRVLYWGVVPSHLR